MIACSVCQEESPFRADFCEHCGASFAKVKEGLQGIDNMAEDLLKKEISKASKTLYVVAAIQFAVGGLLYLANTDGDLLLAIGAIVAGVPFLVLGVTSHRWPLPSTIAGLGIFILMHLLEAVSDPSTIVQGIIMKVVVIAFLVSGLRAAVRHRHYLKTGDFE